MNLAKPGEPGEEREEAGPFNDEDEEDGDFQAARSVLALSFSGGENEQKHTLAKAMAEASHRPGRTRSLNQRFLDSVKFAAMGGRKSARAMAVRYRQ